MLNTDPSNWLQSGSPQAALPKLPTMTAVSGGALNTDVSNWTSAPAAPQPLITPSVSDSVKGGGYLSKTMENVHNFETQSQDQQDNTIANGALPFGISDLNPNLKTSVTLDDINANPLAGIAKIGGNFLGDIPSAVKGFANLFSVSGLQKFIQGAIQDPTALLGPAGQQLATETISQSSNATLLQQLSKVWSGIQNATTAAANHPLLSMLPFLGLADAGATAGELASDPVGSLSKMPGETAASVAKTAGKVADAVTAPVDFIQNLMGKNTSPFTQLANKITTPAQLTESMAQNTSSITGKIGELKTTAGQLGDSVTQLQKVADEAPTSDTSLKLQEAQLELEKHTQMIDTLEQMREGIVQKSISDMEALKQVGIGPKSTSDIGPAMGDMVSQTLKNTGDNYENLLPRDGANAYPSWDGPIKAIEDFRDQLSGTIDSKLSKSVESTLDTLRAKQVVTDLTSGHEGIPTNDDVESALNEKGYTTEKGKVDAEGNPLKLVDKNLIKPASSSLIKTTVQSQIRAALVGDNAGYGKVFGETVAPAITDAIKKNLSSEGATALDKIDATYKALKIDKPSAGDSLAKANTPGKLVSQLSDPELRAALKNADPKLDDMANQAMMKAILEKSKGTDGLYDAEKLNTNLEANKNFVNKNDYLAVKQHILELENNKAALAENAQLAKEAATAQKEAQGNVDAEQKAVTKTAEESQKVVGTTPTEVFKNISSIKSPEDLAAFADNAGIPTTDVGKLYLKSVFDKADPTFASGGAKAFDLNKLGEVDDALQKFGGDGPEAAKVRQQAFGKDGQQLVDSLNKLREQRDLLQDAEKSGKLSSPGARALKIAAGGVLLGIKFFWSGARLIKEGVTSGGEVDLDSVGARNEGGPAPEAPKTTGGIKGAGKAIINAARSKPAIITAGEAANINNNEK